MMYLSADTAKEIYGNILPKDRVDLIDNSKYSKNTKKCFKLYRNDLNITEGQRFTLETYYDSVFNESSIDDVKRYIRGTEVKNIINTHLFRIWNTNNTESSKVRFEFKLLKEELKNISFEDLKNIVNDEFKSIESVEEEGYFYKFRGEFN